MSWTENYIKYEDIVIHSIVKYSEKFNNKVYRTYIVSETEERLRKRRNEFILINDINNHHMMSDLIYNSTFDKFILFDCIDVKYLLSISYLKKFGRVAGSYETMECFVSRYYTEMLDNAIIYNKTNMFLLSNDFILNNIYNIDTTSSRLLRTYDRLIATGGLYDREIFSVDYNREYESMGSVTHIDLSQYYR